MICRSRDRLQRPGPIAKVVAFSVLERCMNRLMFQVLGPHNQMIIFTLIGSQLSQLCYIEGRVVVDPLSSTTSFDLSSKLCPSWYIVCGTANDISASATHVAHPRSEAGTT